ncbi:T9SS type A sorting domain-containing protein [Flavicella sp.]|uniref:T9SS type A sorting domain-containing protein n=1 Tax=Flavicella sp. TaxID=2957742 RepID=UPI002625C5D6|nr:T9SS type A sorting domain-containing protein [Flavicella sp.]MDG1805613.1 T9SS type A sorting domain-containing protein [Flavicella sp.]
MGVTAGANSIEPTETVRVRAVDEEYVSLASVSIEEKTKIQIKDMEGVVLYTEEFEVGNTYRKKLDMTDLPSGVYYLKVVDGKKATVYTLEKSYESLEVDKKFESPTIDQEMLNILKD